MWTRDRIVEDLGDLRIRSGDSLIVHASMQAIGEVDGECQAVLEALLEAVGPQGTVLAPAFDRANVQPAGQTPDDASDLLADRIAGHPGAWRSDHPAFSFAAIGHNGEWLTAAVPFDYPLGENSPLARLYSLDGGILLLGASYAGNVALHLAEAWADAPYARRAAEVGTAEDGWRRMYGAPGCRVGFGRIEPVLRQARILRSGYVGNALSQYMRIRHVVSMAVAMLRGDPESLLCTNPDCTSCTAARRFTAQQDALPPKRHSW